MKFSILSTVALLSIASVAANEAQPLEKRTWGSSNAKLISVTGLSIWMPFNTPSPTGSSWSSASSQGWSGLESWASNLVCALSSFGSATKLNQCKADNMYTAFNKGNWFTSDLDETTCNFMAQYGHNCFFNSLLQTCVSGDYGPSSTIPASSDGYTCPANWKWGGTCCVPTTSAWNGWTTPYSLAPNLVNSCTTPGHAWSSSHHCCKPAADTSTNTSSTCTDYNSIFWPFGKTCCNLGLAGGTCDTDSYSKPQSCPTSAGWVWDPIHKVCNPHTSDTCKGTTAPTCETQGHYYCQKTKTCRQCSADSSASTSYCSNIDSNSFPWSPLGVSGALNPFGIDFSGKICVNSGTTGGSCTADTNSKPRSCPDSTNWIFDAIHGCCTPKTTTGASSCTGSGTGGKQPTCSTPGHHWDSKQNCCVQITPNTGSTTDCKNIWGGFWWGLKNTCCNTGHTAGTCPTGKSCPTDWAWCPINQFCVPKTPTQGGIPTPSCGSGWWWDKDNTCCSNGPSSKPKTRRRGALKSKLPLGVVDSARCPDRLTACPVEGSVDGNAYECLDPQTELESCGGCASMGTGVDCSAIPGARSVSCDIGVCKVYTCSAGYVPSIDGKKCVRSKQSLLQSQKRAVARRSHSF